ncbi:MAG: ribosome maturation factor RimP [Methylobacteriaceae bacterium]|jgi:ribosome maturation factor RimP|nr:ribosome maturation factor RimP [Methylobacteriaceae bacterium]
MSEERLLTETGIAAVIARLVEPVAGAAGFRLVRVRVTGERGCTVQIMAERDDGSMTIEDCEALSEMVSPVLELEDPVSGRYHLEISSPGMDRPLVRMGDFAQWAGQEARIEMRIPAFGRKRFRGVLAGVDGEGVRLRLADAREGEAAEVLLMVRDMADARLVLTDDLIREALRRGSVPQIQDEEDVEVKYEPRRTRGSRKKTAH